jgi:hypothetical protein
MGHSSLLRLHNTARLLVVGLVAAILVAVPIGQPAQASAGIVFADRVCDLSTAGYLGTGSAADPYLISDSPSLWEISDCSRTGSPLVAAHFKLTNDISLQGVTDAPTSSPIGYTASGSVTFSGVLDGQNHSITGIAMSTSAGFDARVGLIWSIFGATVRNLSISGSVTYSGTSTGIYAGGLAGYSTTVNLFNVTNNVQVQGHSRVGGLVGYVHSNANIFDSVNLATIAGGNDHVGGLVGYVQNESRVENSVNQGAVSGRSNVCGLIGSSVVGNLNFVSVSNEAMVSGTGSNVGGLVGVRNFSFTTITDSRNSGRIEAHGAVGGIVGNLSAAPGGSISSTVNLGQVIGRGPNVGGIIGTTTGDIAVGNIENLGPVSSPTDNVGGLIGYAKADLTIASSLNAATVSSQLARVGGLVGRADGAVTIEISLNKAEVSGGNYVGGLIGSLPSASHVVLVASSSNVGSVTGTGGNIGGLIGYIQSGTIDLDYSYNAGPVSGSSSIDGLVGLSSANVSTTSAYSLVVSNFVQASSLTQMQSASLYSDWDFTPTGTWGFGTCEENNGLPLLRFANEVATFYSDACFTEPVATQDQPQASSSEEVPIAAPVYRGPMVLSAPQSVSVGALVQISGSRFATITKIMVGDVPHEILSLSAGQLSFEISQSMVAGTYDLRLFSSFGSLTVMSHITLVFQEPLISRANSPLIGMTALLPKDRNAQEAWMLNSLPGSGLNKIVCTAIVTRDMTAHQRIQVRKLAKAACDEAAELLPGASVWHQSKLTIHERFARKVAVTFKG